jgi:NADH/F420H2 dehydrogenase subunit C
MSDTPRENDHEDPEAPVSGDVVADEVAAVLCERFDGVFRESCGQPVVYLDRARLAEAATHLRDEEQFTMCVDVTAVDHLTNGAHIVPDGVEPERFEVVCNLLSNARNRRIRIICQVPESDPRVPSITPIYGGANFAEREVFDLFGIAFDGHPELTRILMPDDWEGHPLRKDFAPARVPVTFKGDPSPR